MDSATNFPPRQCEKCSIRKSKIKTAYVLSGEKHSQITKTLFQSTYHRKAMADSSTTIILGTFKQRARFITSRKVRCRWSSGELTGKRRVFPVPKVSEGLRCCALDWNKSAKDYIPCSDDEAVMCKAEGLLITVNIPLCEAHQQHFDSVLSWMITPKGWKVPIGGRRRGR